MARLRRIYGAGPAHLVAMVIALAFAGYAIYAIFQNSSPWAVLAWLALAVIAHDFVFLPLYTGAYRLAWRTGRVERDKDRRVPILHHLVVPTIISVLLLVVALPSVLRLSGDVYRPTTGMTQDPFLWRWLALTGGLFVASAVIYALRRARLRRAPRAEGAERVAEEPGEGTDLP